MQKEFMHIWTNIYIRATSLDLSENTHEMICKAMTSTKNHIEDLPIWKQILKILEKAQSEEEVRKALAEME